MVNSGHAKHTSLGGGSGGPPQNSFEKVSALRLILVGFGNQALTTVVMHLYLYNVFLLLFYSMCRQL